MIIMLICRVHNYIKHFSVKIATVKMHRKFEKKITHSNFGKFKNILRIFRLLNLNILYYPISYLHKLKKKLKQTFFRIFFLFT